MKLPWLILITLFLFLFTESNAQRCYYRSFQDLDSGRSVHADFRMQRLSVRKLRRHLGPEYRLKCGLHTKRKILNNALFVQVDSELFVNGRKLLSDDVSVGKGIRSLHASGKRQGGVYQRQARPCLAEGHAIDAGGYSLSR